MAENVDRKRSGSVTLKGKGHKNKSVEVTVGDDTTIGAIKNQIVRKLAGGRYEGEISTEQTSKSAGGVKIVTGEFHVATYAKCSMKGEHSVAKMSKSDWIKIVTEEEVTETKPVMENEENIGTPVKRKRGADGEMVLTYFSSQERSSPRLRPRKEASFRMVDLDEDDDGRIVGKRIKVYWPESRKWFIGHIKAFNDKKRLHSILYDDGDKEELDLRNERFELEIMPTEAFSSKAKSTSKKKVWGSDGNKIGAIMLPKETFESDDAKVAVNSPVSTKVGKRGSSKLRKNGTRVMRMDSNVFPHDHNKVITGENCAAEEPVKQIFDKEHEERKSLAEIAREATEKLEAQAIQLGPNSGVKKMGSCSDVGEGSNSIESDDSISVAYAKLVKKSVSLKKKIQRTSNMNSSKLLSRKDNNEVEKLDAGMEVYEHGDDEVKMSKGHGDIIVNEAVEEVNDQTVNHKMDAVQPVCENKGGASNEGPSTTLDHCAEIAIADTWDREKQEKTENIKASLLSSHDMKEKGIVEDLSPNIEVSVHIKNVDEEVRSEEISVQGLTDVLTTAIHSNRRSVLKAAGEEGRAVSVNLQATLTKNPEEENADILQEKLRTQKGEINVNREEVNPVSHITAGGNGRESITPLKAEGSLLKEQSTV
ncbi:hypothetical protein Ddye_022915 [Dipteronia dyeriana]|uniref:Tudor domain-containing protein n=1 Tax=Dipteronia dyeriana TaxID=168575 RepID=A0AAD9TRZ8_9ROSI|nr:hypothetical protein Ddye_022915 [Dipteronia dyeriana]